MKNIAVERSLSNVSDYLNKHGYNIQQFDIDQKNNKDFIDGFDAVIISGLSNNPMGIETTMAKTSIIEARGLTPQEVKMEIERRLQ
jgi:galactitol-specific phosphotransferase system IIB component